MVASDLDRKRAERTFARQQRAADGERAANGYEIQARATREKVARLKALRLAKEAETQQQTVARRSRRRSPRK